MSEYRYYYGYALEMLAKTQGGRTGAQQGDELKPKNPDILTELGHVYLKLGFPLRAKGYFGKALKLDPSNDRAKEGVKMVESKKPRCA